jgi:hypothetical protein
LGTGSAAGRSAKREGWEGAAEEAEAADEEEKDDEEDEEEEDELDTTAPIWAGANTRP